MYDRELIRAQRDEAVRRMGDLGLGQLCIGDLRRGVTWTSKPAHIFDVQVGAAAPAAETVEFTAARDWLASSDPDALVYHALVCDALFADSSVCRMVHLLFVGSDTLEWSYERPIKQDVPDPGTVFHIYCASYNASDPARSILELISVRSLGGGLVRIS